MYKRLFSWIVTGCLLLAATLFLAKSLYDNTLKNQAYDRHAQSIKTSRALFHEHTLRAVQDIQQLAAIPTVNDYIEQPTPATLARVQQVILATSEIYGRYDQIRLISLEGQELVRINNLYSDARIISTSNLQNKESRYFFQEGLKLEPNQVYMSPIDLNFEQGIVDKPYKPTIRLVRPMENSQGERVALLVLNYKAEGLISQFRNIYSQFDRAMLINDEGYWISNHQQANEWGWIFGSEHLRIQVENPELWDAMQAEKAGRVEINGNLFSFDHINIALFYGNTSHANDIDDLGLLTICQA